MLDFLMPKLLEDIFGKAIPSMLEEATGITARTWRDGGPKRKSSLERGRARSEQRLVQVLRDGGWSETEIVAYRNYLSADGNENFPFSNLVRMWGVPGRYEYQHTLVVAKLLDQIDGTFQACRNANDVQGFKKAYRDEVYLALVAWLTFAGELKDVAAIQFSLDHAESWEECTPLIATASLMAFYRLFSCWEIEYLAACLTNKDSGRGIAPQPIVEFLMPKLKPEAKKLPNGMFSSRGLFHLPLRRLLDLCYCFSILHREGKWPSKNRITRTQVAGAGGNVLQGDASDQPLAKMRKGLRGLSAEEFRDVWISMVGQNDEGRIPMPPWPWYIATQALTRLFVQKSERFGAMTVVTPGSHLYRYWWEQSFSEIKAQGVRFGNYPWPSYLQAD